MYVVILPRSKLEYFRIWHYNRILPCDNADKNHRLPIWYRQLWKSWGSKTIHPYRQSMSHQFSDRSTKQYLSWPTFFMRNFSFFLLIEDLAFPSAIWTVFKTHSYLWPLNWNNIYNNNGNVQNVYYMGCAICHVCNNRLYGLCSMSAYVVFLLVLFLWSYRIDRLQNKFP